MTLNGGLHDSTGAIHAGVVRTGLVFGSRPAAAQESRGSIAGLVVDSSGGALPGVTVTIRNIGTNATVVQTTNDAGQYTAVLLLPGTYNVTVELSGFQKREYSSVQVHVGERVQLDATLAPASVSESVLVVGESPQLESGSATIGQVINSTLISEIPLGDGTAYGLTRLIPGASFERSYALQRPMDNDNLRGMTITGTINSEFTIDGSSNVVSQARAGIQPPSDAIEEFKVETAAYDAQIGHTGAGAVNLALKSGHEPVSRLRLVLQPRRLAIGEPLRVQPERLRKDAAQLQPVQRRDRRPDLQEQDVLHVLVREAAGRHDRVVHQLGADREDADGRFLRAAGEWRADFRSAHRAPRQRRRRRAIRFPGNIIPADRINPVARNVLGYFPAANQAAAADFSQNFFAEQPWTYAYDFQMMRIDHEWTADHRTYGRFIRNFRREERYNFAGEISGVEITRGATDRFNFNYAARAHRGAVADAPCFDMKGSWLRFNDDLFPLYDNRSREPRYSLRRRRRSSATTQQLPSFSLESGSADRRRDASRRLGRSRAASTADAFSRSTTCRLRRR